MPSWEETPGANLAEELASTMCLPAPSSAIELSVGTYDAIPAEIVAARVFGDVSDPIIEYDFDDAEPDQGDRYVARMALEDTEREAKFVESLNERRERVARAHDDDPAAVSGLHRLARTAWHHHRRACAVAAGAMWDPVVGPMAVRVVARAERAARAITRAAARAATRAAIRARNSARARIGVFTRLGHVRRPMSPSARPRAPHARRRRVSAVHSSGNDEPSPEPPGLHDRACLPAGRQP